MCIHPESTIIEPFHQLFFDKLLALERGFQLLLEDTVDLRFLLEWYFISLSSIHMICLSKDGISLSFPCAKTFILGGESSLLEYSVSSSSAIGRRWTATLNFSRGFIVMIEGKGLRSLGALECGWIDGLKVDCVVLVGLARGFAFEGVGLGVGIHSFNTKDNIL